MARAPSGKDISKSGNMSADYGVRAGVALDRLVPGPHRDKRIARMFGVSPRMARHLRCGQHWTIDRLSQASAMIQGFDSFIASPEQLHARIEELRQQIDDLAAVIRGKNGGS